METAIIYYSKHGTTKRVAEMLASKLTVEKTFIDLKTHKSPNIEKYDSIICLWNGKRRNKTTRRIRKSLSFRTNRNS